MFEIGKLPSLDLGYQGENRVRTIDIDMTAWLEEYPGSKVALMVKRPDEDVYYPAGKMEGNVLLWVIDRADRQYAGRGEAQVILKGADDVELRTRVVKTKISPSLSGTEVEAPPPYATWVGDVLDAAAQAEAAVEKMPSIGENGNWYAWDAVAGAYVDTGKPSRGEQGIKGKRGETGPAGSPGREGKAATVKVGKVTTLPAGSAATVTNSGTENSAVLDFGIPKGADGTGGGGSGEAGADGEDGGYYTPSVTTAGLLSWTPSKSGMPAVPSADIKGPKGDAGYTPVKGKDYVDGTSVTVKSVSTSSADGGSNVVTFSDGKTVTIKNGSKGGTGDRGETGPAGKDAVTSAVALTIASTAWAGDEAPYTATVTCNGVTASNHIIVGAGGALTAEQQSAMAAAMIVCTSQASGSVTLTAFGEKPGTDLPVNVLIVG